MVAQGVHMSVNTARRSACAPVLVVGVRSDVHFEADRRIVVEDAAAAFAEHHLAAVTKILEELGAQQNLAGGAAAFGDFGHGRSAVPLFADPLVGGVSGFL